MESGKIEQSGAMDFPFIVSQEVPDRECGGKIDCIACDTFARAEEALHCERIGIRDYKVIGVEDAEFNGWREEVLWIRDALKSGDREVVSQAILNGREKDTRKLDMVYKMLQAGNIDERGLTLLAIGLWCLKKKSRPPKVFAAIKKFYKGGEHSLSDFIDEHGNATCLDIAILAKELARSFGIDGNLYRFGALKIGHACWISGKGEVLDIIEFDKRGGYFSSVKRYAEASARRISELMEVIA